MIVGLLKIKVFWNEVWLWGHNFLYDVPDIILTRYANYFVDVVMWPKFGNSSISMRVVIITSIL